MPADAHFTSTTHKVLWKLQITCRYTYVPTSIDKVEYHGSQYVSCLASGSVVRDGGSGAVEDTMRHRRVAARDYRDGV